MTPLKAMYCRTFQKAFRTALPVLPYRKPEILHDIKEIPDVLQEKNCRAVLLVTDKSIREHGLTERLEKALAKAHISCTVFETVVNPTTDIIEKAVDLYRKQHCTSLIGFGGGSSIDTAKAVGACIVNPGRTLAQMSGILKVRKQLPPLFAVPTTAGT